MNTTPATDKNSYGSSDWSSGSYSTSRRRSKEDWAGVNPGNAFKSDLSYYVRMPAQALFYRMARDIQTVAARQAGQSVGRDFQPKTKPQLAPCYTTYPPPLAAYAALGLTGFLEFKVWASRQALTLRLKSFIQLPDWSQLDQKAFQKTLQIVAETVQNRLLLEELSKTPKMVPVENYRLFCASQHSTSFSSVPDIIKYVVLSGDVLPNWEKMELHPMTRAILVDLEEASRPFLSRLPRTQHAKAMELGVAWVEALIRALAKYLPPRTEEPTPPKERPQNKDRPPSRFTNSPPQAPPPTDIAPLGGSRPPSLFDPVGAKEQIASALTAPQPTPANAEKGSGPGQDSPDPSPPATLAEFAAAFEELMEANEVTETLKDPNIPLQDPALRKILDEFSATVSRAVAQTKGWEDMRSDIVENMIRKAAFAPGPIEGLPTDGHEVRVKCGDEYYAGQLHDRAVGPSGDSRAYDALMAESKPIARKMKRLIYPNQEIVSEPERFMTTGQLDSSRLALAEFSSAVFKRYRRHQVTDKRGRPVILIINDGSGSVRADQMRLMKVLSMAWLQSSLKSRVRVLAGMYHQGQAQKGVSAHIVEWLYHPEKTPAISPKDALRSIAAMPEKGSGGQADALSFQFMVDEARKFARGKSVYVILIADCQWCNSFQQKKLTAAQEVRSYFESAYKEMKDKLHVTLIGLDARVPEDYADILDKVIAVSQEELKDYAAIADKIGTYVATCMRERRKLSGR